MFGGDGFFDDFLDGEGGVSGGVEVAGSAVECAVPGSPLVEFSDDFVFVAFSDVHDVAEAGDHVDIDATALRIEYPSSPTLFWNDIKLYLLVK